MILIYQASSQPRYAFLPSMRPPLIRIIPGRGLLILLTPRIPRRQVTRLLSALPRRIRDLGTSLAMSAMCGHAELLKGVVQVITRVLLYSQCVGNVRISSAAAGAAYAVAITATVTIPPAVRGGRVAGVGAGRAPWCSHLDVFFMAVTGAPVRTLLWMRTRPRASAVVVAVVTAGPQTHVERYAFQVTGKYSFWGYRSFLYLFGGVQKGSRMHICNAWPHFIVAHYISDSYSETVVDAASEQYQSLRTDLVDLPATQ